MPFEPNQFLPLVPEIVLLTLACAVMLIDLGIRQRNRVVTYWLAQFTVFATAFATWLVSDQTTAIVLNGTFVLDPMAVGAKYFVCLVVFAVFLYSKDYLSDRSLFKGEYYVLGLFGLLGMMILISAASLLTLYLGLELLALSLYAMVAFDRDNAVASEAAMKYFVLGAMASGMLLYGMSILYGVTGSLQLEDIASVSLRDEEHRLATVFALSFIVIGIAFKFGAVPFHMWVPDIYQGAPTSVTLYLGSAPKIAAFVLAMRLLVDGLAATRADWSQMLAVLAVLSLAIGNVVAIAQTNIKRMLGYSTISHVGFLLLGLLAGTDTGYASAMFYAITYAITAAAGFGIIVALSRKGFEAERLDDYRGLNDRHPWLAFLMMLVMFSMAGVPPMVGFFAKLAVIEAVIEAGQVWLAVVAVFFSVIGAYYYLRVVKMMYFDTPESEREITLGSGMRLLLSANALVLLVLGWLPGGLLTWCARWIAAS